MLCVSVPFFCLGSQMQPSRPTKKKNLLHQQLSHPQLELLQTNLHQLLRTSATDTSTHLGRYYLALESSCGEVRTDVDSMLSSESSLGATRASPAPNTSDKCISIPGTPPIRLEGDGIYRTLGVSKVIKSIQR